MSFRIVHLGPLDLPSHPERADALAERIRALSPDLVLCTGSVGHANFDGATAWFAALGTAFALVPGPDDLVDDPDDDACNALRARCRVDKAALGRLLGEGKKRAVLDPPLKAWRKAFSSPADAPGWSHTIGAVGIAGLNAVWAGASAELTPLVGERQARQHLDAIASCAARVVAVHCAPSLLHESDALLPTLLAPCHLLLHSGPGPRVESRDALVIVQGGPSIADAASPPVAPTFHLVTLDDDSITVQPWVWHLEQWKEDRNTGVSRFDRKEAARATPVPTPAAAQPRPFVPRRYVQPDLPDWPFPELSPVEHPSLLGGRDVDLDRLHAAIVADDPCFVHSLHGPSGAGKSSLLRAGLLPRLRMTGQPAALTAVPAQPGVFGRLLHDLHRDGWPSPPDDDDPTALRAALRAIHPTPILVFDQAEDLFERPAALGNVSALLAACAAEATPPARFLFAYRQDFHGRVEHWLRDVLGRAPHLPAAQRASWPTDVSRFVRRAELWLLGDPGPTADRCVASAALFRAALDRPWNLKDWGVPFAQADRQRLAEAFARHRTAHRDDALAPELQAVLARLKREVAQGRARALEVPDDPDALERAISDAIRDHLKDRLDAVARTCADPSAIPVRRTLALLLLDRLVGPDGRRLVCRRDDVVSGLGDDARGLLHGLAGSGVWLVRADRDDLLSLPHDRLAAQVFALRTDSEAAAHVGLDGATLALWRRVELRYQAWREGDQRATSLAPEDLRAVERHRESLPWRPELDPWWAAVQRVAAELEARARADARRGLELEARGWEPGSGRPLLALRSLFDTHSVRRGDLLSALGRPGEPGFDPDRRLAVLALGPAGLASADRDRLLPELVAELAGGTSGREDDVPLLGAMLAALEAVDNAAAVAEAERAIRAALGRVRMPPPPPDPDDGTWSPTVHGRFTIGRFAIEQTRGQADEVLHDVVLSPYRLRRHAETLQEIRRLLPNHSKNFLRAGEPARAVDWYTARAYACWSCASLPSEAQWEVACRGGNWEYRRTEWYFGSSATTARRWLLTGESSTEHLLLARLPIEGAPRHPLGLIHMHGNVSEWCIDWYAPYNLNLSTDPTGPRFPPPGARRVIRGGSWHAKLRFCRAASRAGYNPAIRGTGVGLRLALPQPGSVVDR